MKLDPVIRDQVLATVPSLRAFAISLCGNIDRADDLVQETLLRALAHIDSFQPGTNMPAWLFTILRNLFRSEYRKRRREVEDADGRYAETLKSHPEQTGRVEFSEFRAALAKLPSDQREALILVGASGFSYEDAPSAPLRAGLIGRVRGSPTCWRLTASTISARTAPPAPCSPAADGVSFLAAGEGKRPPKAMVSFQPA
jgi:RNA polymerase sigma-70 factor (ECF subfamily)